MKQHNLCSLPFIHPDLRPTMDIGIIHTSHLMHMQEYLTMMKTYDTSKENLLKLKQQLIYNENLFLGLPAKCYRYNVTYTDEPTKFTYGGETPSHFIVNDISELITTKDETIQTVYFKTIDLHKYQRNFEGPTYKLVIDL